VSFLVELNIIDLFFSYHSGGTSNRIKLSGKGSKRDFRNESLSHTSTQCSREKG